MRGGAVCAHKHVPIARTAARFHVCGLHYYFFFLCVGVPRFLQSSPPHCLAYTRVQLLSPFFCLFAEEFSTVTRPITVFFEKCYVDDRPDSLLLLGEWFRVFSSFFFDRLPSPKDTAFSW